MTTARDLSARLRQLLRAEQGAMADFLLALVDFDRRQAWRELGHTGLFSYLHRELGLSKGAAFYKKTAAELLQAYPEVIEPLRDGRLCLSTVGELARVITPENKDRVLPTFFHLSKREAQEVAAALDPVAVPPRREVVTAVRPALAVATLAVAAPPAGSPDEFAPQEVQPDELGVRPADRPAEPAPALPARPPPPPRSTAEPLTEALSRLHLTVSKEFLRKLEAARDALSHSRPGASADEILEAGLDLLLQRVDRRRGLVAKPRKAAPATADADSDHIPADIRRAVWLRDQGRCRWPMQDGHVCGSTRWPELDHVVPKTRGGPSTVANLRILCHGHNQLAARLALGNALMDRFAGRAASASTRRGGPPGYTVGSGARMSKRSRRCPSRSAASTAWGASPRANRKPR